VGTIFEKRGVSIASGSGDRGRGGGDLGHGRRSSVVP